MYSFSYLGPVCCSMSSSNCCFLTCIQVSQEACQVVWYSHLFQNFPQSVVIHTVKGFGIVNKAVQFSSVPQSCPTLCNPMNHSTPGLPVQLLEFTQTLSWWCHPTILSSVIPFSSCLQSFPDAQKHQGLFKWVSSSHQVAKILEFQLQHQSFQWTPRTDLL